MRPAESSLRPDTQYLVQASRSTPAVAVNAIPIDALPENRSHPWTNLPAAIKRAHLAAMNAPTPMTYALLALSHSFMVIPSFESSR